ncbi:MAG: LptF/LptG family permease [Candidatus Omnitrophica bacterium]|nr:LptF/LptG family permease [Candidatus Omnitrophota bacterium]
MRILDRYAARQLFPVWVWCLLVFMFLSCLIDLFEHLDEILRYHIPVGTMVQYYLNFLPIVFVRASPLALLLSAAFVATRLSRHQELLAMNASGTSLLRASVPFLFIGWLAALGVFFVNDRVVPRSSLIYDQIRRQVFRSPDEKPESLDNVAVMDAFNRLYHARVMDPKTKGLYDLTILEHDWNNRPTKGLYASRAVWTKFGWLLLHGTMYRVGPRGVLQGDPEPFVERLISYPVTPEQFAQPDSHIETMRFSQLRLLITRLKQIGMKNVRRYSVELMAKLTLPLMNLIVCLIAFAGSTQPQLRGNLRGLGLSLGWGLLYYFLVGFGEGVGKKGMFLLPTFVAVWAPHFLAVWWSLRLLGRTP